MVTDRPLQTHFRKPQPSMNMITPENPQPPQTHVLESQPGTTLTFAEPPAASALVPSSPADPGTAPAAPPAGATLLNLQFGSLQAMQTRPAGKPRNGKIAHLPMLERDMVNRMLANNLPHRKIVVALDERGFHVTERNISNWKTRGGYKEWTIAQERALELRTFQDNLTGFLRRHDAAELAEVGLQSVATNLSAILLRPDLMRELLAAPEKYGKLIELQCRLASHLQPLQKSRDEAAISLGPRCKPERVKRKEEQEVERIREAMSSKPGRSAQEDGIPHRNFIPKQIEFLPSDSQLMGLEAFQRLMSGRLGDPGPTPSKATPSKG